MSENSFTLPIKPISLPVASDHPEERQVATLDACERAVMEAGSVEEVLEIQDKAAAVREYARRKRGEGKDLFLKAAILGFRTDRRIGELLQSVELPTASPGNQHTDPTDGTGPVDRSSSTTSPPDASVDRSSSATGPKTLAELGITKDESSYCQKISNLDDSEFQQFLADCVDGKCRPSKAAILKRIKTPEPERIASIADLTPLIDAGRTFRTIFCAPWQNCDRSPEELLSEPVVKVVASSAHLHLRTPIEQLPIGLQLMDAWGFEYASQRVWLHPAGESGAHWRTGHELVLLGVRGNLKLRGKSLKSWTRNSIEYLRKTVERVSPGPYLEVHGREEVCGWTVYGKAVERKAC